MVCPEAARHAYRAKLGNCLAKNPRGAGATRARNGARPTIREWVRETAGGGGLIGRSASEPVDRVQARIDKPGGPFKTLQRAQLRCTMHWPPAFFRFEQNALACSDVWNEPTCTRYHVPLCPSSARRMIGSRPPRTEGYFVCNAR